MPCFVRPGRTRACRSNHACVMWSVLSLVHTQCQWCVSVLIMLARVSRLLWSTQSLVHTVPTVCKRVYYACASIQFAYVHSLSYESPVLCFLDAQAHTGEPRAPAVACTEPSVHTVSVVCAMCGCAYHTCVSIKYASVRTLFPENPVLCVLDAHTRIGEPRTPAVVYTKPGAHSVHMVYDCAYYSGACIKCVSAHNIFSEP
jgi:hypothetical protein